MPRNIAADATAQARDDYLKREAIASVVINAALSILLFLAVFGWHRTATRSLAIDFLPQTAGITFLGGFVPALLTLRRIAAGRMVAAGPPPSAVALAVRVLACAFIAMTVLGGCAAGVLAGFAPRDLDPVPALALKALYGGLAGLITTPPILRMTLGLPLFGRQST